MQNQNTKINFLVGLFVLSGIVALLFLALQAANLSRSLLPRATKSPPTSITSAV